MTKPIVFASVLFAVSAGVLGCTANVENPTVNQTGRNSTTCIKSCDDTKTTCVGKCSDDSCKASCTTTRDSCATSCSSVDAGTPKGQAGSTVSVTVTCTKSCDETKASCIGSCNDDGCRASCTTSHDTCVTHCQ